MRVGGVEGGVVVEVFLDVDEGVVILREEGADELGVGGFVAWDVVGVEDGGEAGDICG